MNRHITYPADAQRRVADRLMDLDMNLPDDEAMGIAFDITTDVTMAVDKLRVQEGYRLVCDDDATVERMAEAMGATDGWWETRGRYQRLARAALTAAQGGEAT